MGVWTHLWRRTLEGRGRVRGVKLRAGAVRAFVSTPAFRFSNRIVPLASVFGASVAKLERAVLAPEDDDEAFGLLEAWLRAWLAKASGPAEERAKRMNAVNPKYVPRNYLAQQAIDAMARGDASVLERLMKVLARPYDEQPGQDDLAERRPEWARSKPGCSALSCSS